MYYVHFSVGYSVRKLVNKLINKEVIINKAGASHGVSGLISRPGYLLTYGVSITWCARVDQTRACCMYVIQL